MNVSSVVTLQFSFNDFTQQGGFSYIVIHPFFCMKRPKRTKNSPWIWMPLCLMYTCLTHITVNNISTNIFAYYRIFKNKTGSNGI